MPWPYRGLSTHLGTHLAQLGALLRNLQILDNVGVLEGLKQFKYLDDKVGLC